jgi:hypothetical protein
MHLRLHGSSNQERFQKCVLLAKRAGNAEHRQLWLCMAETWKKLAEQNSERIDAGCMRPA